MIVDLYFISDSFPVGCIVFLVFERSPQIKCKIKLLLLLILLAGGFDVMADRFGPVAQSPKPMPLLRKFG